MTVRGGLPGRPGDSPQIAVITGKLDRGGTELQLFAVLPRLVKLGFGITVLTLHGGGTLVQAFRNAGVGVVDGTSARGWHALVPIVGRLARKLRALRPDVIHYFLPEAYLLGSVASLAMPSAVRVMSRRSLNDYQRGYPGVRRIERMLHRRTSVVLGNSRAVVSQLAEERVHPERLGLIYNGITTQAAPAEEMRARARRDLGLSDAVVAGLTIANLIPYKGHEILLDALARVRCPQGRSLAWFCVGRDNGIGAALRQRARDLGIEGIVRWDGEREDLTPYLLASDVAALPSLQEGFSNALLEMMNAGLAVAATDVGGNAEALGSCGRLVPAGDPAALASALQGLIDMEDRVILGTAARDRVMNEFSLDRCVALYAELYQNLAEGRRPAVPGGARVDSS